MIIFAPSLLPGTWERAPRRRRRANGYAVHGADFFETAAQDLGALPFIAEDLGLITPDATALPEQFRLTGMRVLQFAFDGQPDNPYLPHNFVRAALNENPDEGCQSQPP